MVFADDCPTIWVAYGSSEALGVLQDQLLSENRQDPDVTFLGWDDAFKNNESDLDAVRDENDDAWSDFQEADNLVVDLTLGIADAELAEEIRIERVEFEYEYVVRCSELVVFWDVRRDSTTKSVEYPLDHVLERMPNADRIVLSGRASLSDGDMVVVAGFLVAVNAGAAVAWAEDGMVALAPVALAPFRLTARRHRVPSVPHEGRTGPQSVDCSSPRALSPESPLRVVRRLLNGKERRHRFGCK
eukprot:CAMPEP_0204136352 /NCGR_PEP_ID=MMETSP0361-20130328/16780_1 /ASSEMBLY_ACC=CAM_ASM_000343 /TAXON_ID=268821 /ORGANISM="Scrippsiella Hangoei, Strain SHTV-5" /LENGTH=243 /DNA_ID=CAMNT_0051089855 /DNA_START=69 /DNA_END=801 /DNA_ORIENTATION=-